MDTLLARQPWHDQHVIALIAKNLESLLAGATPAEQKRLLELCGQSARAQEQLSTRLRQLQQGTQDIAVELLAIELQKKAGYAIDPLSARLHTPAPDRNKRATAAGHEAQPPMQRTLWQAARDSFGFNISQGTGSGREFTDNSYLVDAAGNTLDGIEVKDFVNIVRDLDLGQQIKTNTAAQVKHQLTTPLHDLCEAQTRFALIHDHCRNGQLLDGTTLVAMLETITDAEQHWYQQALKVDSQTLLLPFFVCQASVSHGDSFYVYMPHRPGGAWRRHPSLASAQASLLQQIRDSAEQGDLGWLFRQMSLDDQQVLSSHLRTPPENADDFSWVARQLYQLFGSTDSATERLAIQEHHLETKSLASSLQDELAVRIYRDITRLATSNQAADRQTLVRGAQHVVSETLDMLLLPLPGGLLGAGKLVLMSMLGTLAYQTASAVLARQHGNSAQFVQAMLDIVDLVISARIAGVGARLSQQRSRQLVSQMGNPRMGKDSADQAFIEWSPTGAALPREPAWIDHPGLSDIELLRKMLPADWPVLADASLARALRLAEVSHYDLATLWDRGGATPAPLDHLLHGEKCRGDLDALREALNAGTVLPELANEVLPALLARQLGSPIWVNESQGDKPGKKYSAADISTAQALVLTHVGQRLYRCAALESGADARSLMEAVILEHDRLSPGNTLGKSGDFSTDVHIAHRASRLRTELLERFDREQQHVYLQTFAGHQRSAAEARSGRAGMALSTLADPRGRGAPADAAHALLALAITLPGWPADLAINLCAASLDSQRQLRSSGTALYSFGAAEASQVLELGQDGAVFVGVDQTSGDPIQARQHPHALADLLLRTLDDRQRDAIGFGLHDAARLTERLLELACLERSDWHGILSEPDWIDLSDTRLDGFRSHLDFSTSTADSDGLHWHEGRQYLQIGDHYYRALVDSDASSPSDRVLRIVREEDPVAQVADNRYRATRLGRSETVMRNSAGHWQGVTTGLAGGMPPKRQGKRVEHSVRLTRKQAEADLAAAESGRRQVEAQGSPHVRAIRRADERVERASAAEAHNSNDKTRAAKLEAIVDRVVLMPAFAEHNLQLIAALDVKAKALDAYETTLLRLETGTRGLFVGEYRGLLVQRVAVIEQLTLCQDLQVAAEIKDLRDHPILHPDEFLQHRRRCLARMDEKLTWCLRREADIETLRERFAGGDVDERLAVLEAGKTPKSIYVKVAQVQFSCDLLSVGEAGFINLHPTFLGKDFRENAIALQVIDQLVPDQHVAVLDGIQREFENLRNAFSDLRPDYLEGPQSAYLDKIIGAVDEFEKLASGRLDRALADSTSSDSAVRLLDDLDLDFLPPPSGAPRQPPAVRKRVIKIKRRGTSSMVMGDIIHEQGRMQVAVTAQDSGEVVHRYQQNAQGQWQRKPADTPATTVDVTALQAAAMQRRAAVEGHLAKAEEMNRRNDNPTSIVEYLERHADELLESARQLPGQAALLIQAAERLNERGRELLIRRYKDPATLDVHRLLFLMEQAEVTAGRVETRLARGKGRQRYYLDVYEIRDTRTGAPLWHAHFHYPEVDSAKDAYPPRGGHLKTLEQSRLGREQQGRQEQAGLPVQRIWRQEIDRASARKLFALAGD